MTPLSISEFAWPVFRRGLGLAASESKVVAPATCAYASASRDEFDDSVTRRQGPEAPPVTYTESGQDIARHVGDLADKLLAFARDDQIESASNDRHKEWLLSQLRQPFQ